MMLRFANVIVVLLLFMTLAWAQAPKSEEAADELLAVCRSDKDVDVAIKACTDLLAMRPIKDEWRENKKHYTSTTYLTTDNIVELHKRRGALYERKREYDLAISDYLGAAILYPRDADILMLLGGACLRKQDTDSAIKYYGEAIEVDPKRTMAFVGRGTAYFIKRDMVPAQEDMKRAATVNPQVMEKVAAACKDSSEYCGLIHNARADTTTGTPADCDFFCDVFRTVLNARSKGFQDIMTGELDSIGTAPVRVKLFGAETCYVDHARNYKCSFPPMEKEKARRRFDEMAKQVEKSLPAGWGKAEQAANWLYVFKHDPEKDPPISISFTPDIFTSGFVVAITVKRL